MVLDTGVCYRALKARDERFDGRIYVAVHTTGVYCRPICRARCPKIENITFYPSASAAHEAGYRPCLRCRPESSPNLAVWHGTSNTVARALSLIESGALESDDVSELAARLGVGDRHLRRLFKQHLGSSPLAVAQNRRILFAKKLIHETNLKMSEIALASGYGSIRRFNATFGHLFGRPPTALRRAMREKTSATVGGGVTLALPFAAPYDWDAIISFLAARAIPGVEHVESQRYVRTVAFDGHHGSVEVTPHLRRNVVSVTVRTHALQFLPAIVAKVRTVFDLGADIRAITSHLRRDKAMARLVRRRPGLRVPGAWDLFEGGVRAILGQQISVKLARRLLGQLVLLCGPPVSSQERSNGLSHIFPTPEDVRRADLSALAIPRTRIHALKLFAEMVAHESLAVPFGAYAQSNKLLARLDAIPGIGAWTSEMISLRVLRDPDAFPAGDGALLRAYRKFESDATAHDLRARVEAFRPWRGYVAQHLWTTDEMPVVESNTTEETAA